MENKAISRVQVNPHPRANASFVVEEQGGESMRPLTCSESLRASKVVKTRALQTSTDSTINAYVVFAEVAMAEGAIALNNSKLDGKVFISHG